MKKLFTLLLMLCAVLSSQAAPPAKLYIFGDTPFGGWSYNPISKGTAVEMTKDGNKFTWTGSISAPCFFAFLSQDGTDWNSLNSNYRLSSTVQAIALDTEYALSTGDRSMKLMPGDYTITVDYTSGSPKLKVTGYVPEIVITGYSVVGAKALFGGENDFGTDLDMTESSTGVYTATVSNVSLAAGSYEYKARANKTWGIAEYPASGNNSLTIAEAGTYNIVFTLTLATSTLTAEATKVSDDAPEVTDLYIVGSMNEWKTQDENLKMTKQTDGTYYFFIEDLKASETEPVNFKFIDNLNQWYGSTNLEEGEEIGPDNCDDIALSTAQSVTNNFIIKGNAKNVKITVDLANMKFSVDAEDGTETTVEAPEHLYLLGNVQGWDPSSGSAEMTRTKMDSDKVKYKYEFTGYFPAGDDAGNTYFSFITALASASDAWGELDGKRYGANEDGEAITADNTVPYDLKAGGNAFKLAEGYYRIELNWKEDGPDIAMWVHTEEAPAAEYVLVGDFNEWNTTTGVVFQENDGKLTAQQEIEQWGNFKVIKRIANSVEWWGAATEDDYTATYENAEAIKLVAGGDGKNIKVNEAANFTFTLDVENMLLSITGFSAPVEEEELALSKFAVFADDEEYITYGLDGGIYTMVATQAWKGIQCWIGDGSTTAGNYLKVSTFLPAKLKIMVFYVGGGESFLEPSVKKCFHYVPLDPDKKVQNVIIQTAEVGYVLFADCAAVEEGPAVGVPEKLFVIGSATGWKPNAGIEMTKQGDVFTCELEADGDLYNNFSFTSKLAENEKGWGEIETSRYGAEADGTDVTLNTAYNVVWGNNNCAFNVKKGQYTLTVDFSGDIPQLTVTGEEAPTAVDAPEHLYILGNIQGWVPSNGSAEMTRTKIEDGKYKYEFTGNFPAYDDSGVTYFSFTSELGDWGDIENYRYGASEDALAIAADNTDPYDLHKGSNAFKLASGYYRIELNWTEEGPALAMWVHSAETPEITDLYLVGEFNSWAAQDANYKFTKREDGKFEFTMNGYVANQKFKFVDNNGTWYGSATGEDEAITEDNCDNIALGVGGVDNNFYALTNGSAVLTVDLSAMTFSVEPTEVVLPQEATYIEGKNFAYFEAPATWGETVYAYTFEAGEGVAAKAPRKASVEWPGHEMELVTTSAAGNKVYRYTTEDTDFNTIIFTDGTNKTADLVFSNAGYYMAVGLVATVPSTSTGIDSLTDQTATQTNAQIYTIDGRRVNAPLSKGLYITNGKKVMIGK